MSWNVRLDPISIGNANLNFPDKKITFPLTVYYRFSLLISFLFLL